MNEIKEEKMERRKRKKGKIGKPEKNTLKGRNSERSKRKKKYFPTKRKFENKIRGINNAEYSEMKTVRRKKKRYNE